jgi:uncharacterized protein
VSVEWDADKAVINLAKHGVSFDEAATVFEDMNALTYSDTTHSASEERYLTVGYSDRVRMLLVVNTQRIENIRIISARKPTPAERRFYEQQH